MSEQKWQVAVIDSGAHTTVESLAHWHAGRNDLRITTVVEESELTAAQQRVAELERERPFWLLYALARECCTLDCEGDDPATLQCHQTDLCVTEWCISCAAKYWMQNRGTTND